MNLRFIRSFVSAAELGGFSRAADSLFVTQAAVAARVAKLEEELGVQLFARDGSTLRLTEQGRKALPLAKKLVIQIEAFLLQVRDPGMIAGSLRIAWTGFVSHLLQPDFIIDLKQRYPRLNVELHTLSSLDVMESFAEGRVDLAICVGAHASRLWVDIPLFALPMCWICSPALFGAKPPVNLAELARKPIITYPVGTLPYQAIVQQLESLGVERPPLYSMTTVGETLTLVCAGTGSALLPPLIVQAQLDSGVLIKLDLPPSTSTLEFHAAYREHGDASLCAEVCAIVNRLATERIDNGSVVSSNKLMSTVSTQR